MGEKPKLYSDNKKGGIFTTYKIDHNTGRFDKISLFDTKDVKGMKVNKFSMNRIVQISPTEVVVEVSKKKKEDILIKVSLQNKK